MAESRSEAQRAQAAVAAASGPPGSDRCAAASRPPRSHVPFARPCRVPFARPCRLVTTTSLSRRGPRAWLDGGVPPLSEKLLPALPYLGAPAGPLSQPAVYV